MRHMRQQLRETVVYRRIVGFSDAVEDLGTHRICGVDVPYSRCMIYKVLKGESGSKRVLARIVEKRPDLLELSFVAEGTKNAARRLGWTPRTKSRALAEMEKRAALRMAGIAADGGIGGFMPQAVRAGSGAARDGEGEVESTGSGAARDTGQRAASALQQGDSHGGIGGAREGMAEVLQQCDGI